MFITQVITVFLLIIFGINSSDSYNILVIFGHPGKSHYDVFNGLFEELSARGHNLTILTHIKGKDTPNKRHVYLRETEPMVHVINLEHVGIKGLSYSIEQLNLVSTFAEHNCKQDLQRTQFQEFLRETHNYDVVLGEMFNTLCYDGLVNKIKAPFIGLSSCTFMPWQYEWYGIPANPAYRQTIFAGFKAPMSFLDRFHNTVVHYLSLFWYHFYMDELAREYSRKYIGYEPADPRNVSLVLVNSHYTIDGATAFPPNIIEVGGIHIDENRKAKRLPEDIESWINNSDSGVIYFSLGSMIKSNTFPEEQLRAFIRAFAKLPQRVLWKWENDTMLDKPDNVMIKKWMPQLDILAHPNVKVFMSHAGLLGTMEAVHYGVPIIVMPQFGDQLHNAYAIENTGAATVLFLQTATEEAITDALKKALDPRTLNIAKELSEKFRDRPVSPMNTAVHWIEHVAKFKGGRHMKSPAADLPLYQYYLLDVIGLIIFLAVSIIYFVYKVTKFSYVKIFNLLKTKKQKVS